MRVTSPRPCATPLPTSIPTPAADPRTPERLSQPKGIQTPMAQGRSTKIISMIEWIRTSRLSIKHSLSPSQKNQPLFQALCTYEHTPGETQIAHECKLVLEEKEHIRNIRPNASSFKRSLQNARIVSLCLVFGVWNLVFGG